MVRIRKQKNNLVVYQAKSGAIELRGDTTKETLWATQAEIARVFEVTPQNITHHIKGIYKEKELKEKATCKSYLQVQIEGGRRIKRSVIYFSVPTFSKNRITALFCS